MSLRCFFLLLIVILQAGCGSKESFVVLSPTKDGSVGALQVATDKGSGVLKEDGKAIFLKGRDTAPSPPTSINAEDTQQVFEAAMQVQPLAPESFVLYFQFNSNELTDDSKKLIGDILAAIGKRQSRDISIIGHTDRTGSDDYNRKLSLERAQLIHDILRTEKVSSEDMTIIYHGEGNPLIPTADNVAEPRNRRVEVMVR